MTTKQIAQFLANIKGNTYLVDGEKARVEGVSINPTTGRVMITTNKGTKFWNKGNTAFTQVFSQQVSPGRTIPSVIARPTDETETLDTKPTVYLRKQDQPTKVHTTTPTSTAPATLPPAQPVLPTPYLYNRIQLLMDLRKINTSIVTGKHKYEMNLAGQWVPTAAAKERDRLYILEVNQIKDNLAQLTRLNRRHLLPGRYQRCVAVLCCWYLPGSRCRRFRWVCRCRYQAGCVACHRSL